MYQKIINHMTGAEAQCIKRIADNASIPFDPANTDYQEYLKWLEAGNTPLPAEQPE
jgi:antitoxin component of RelBE/YafQ-DinJ toxin-antitoxin module